MKTRYPLRASLLALIVASWMVTPGAQTASLPTLTAAFLFNFAKFTEWPGDHLGPAAPIGFCIVDPPVADALQATVSGRTISGHPLMVDRVKTSDSLRGCAVVFAGGLDARQSAQFVEGLKGASVLSVSDTAKFIESGGVVRLFQDGGQMRFAINVDAAGRARLTLSSQLLGLAKIFKEESR